MVLGELILLEMQLLPLQSLGLELQESRLPYLLGQMTVVTLLLDLLLLRDSLQVQLLQMRVDMEHSRHNPYEEVQLHELRLCHFIDPVRMLPTLVSIQIISLK